MTMSYMHNQELNTATGERQHKASNMERNARVSMLKCTKKRKEIKGHGLKKWIKIFFGLRNWLQDHTHYITKQLTKSKDFFAKVQPTNVSLTFSSHPELKSLKEDMHVIKAKILNIIRSF